MSGATAVLTIHTTQGVGASRTWRAGMTLFDLTRRRATISRVSDTWPPPGPQKREPLLEHIRDVWTLRHVETNCTAAIWRSDFGLELPIFHGDELVESRLSRYGEGRLFLIADEVKVNLIAQGWFELPNRTWWDTSAVATTALQRR